MKRLRCFSFLIIAAMSVSCKRHPIVVNTWPFTNSTIKAWDVVYRQQRSAMDAVEQGCTVCEVEQCDTNIGYGGSPEENGETTLDSMIMDGKTMKVGAVAVLRNIKEAISVARHIFHYTKHTLLVGDLSTVFAINMSFQQQTLSTSYNTELINDWKNRNCQPNYWQNVMPLPETTCGPYEKMESIQDSRQNQAVSPPVDNHDTIGMVVIDGNGNVAAGTSTNGLTYKIPGRVGDSPIPGSGNSAGDAVATFLAVEFLRNGFTVQQAAEMVIDRITKHYPQNSAAVLVVDMEENYGSARRIFSLFPISIYHDELLEVKVETTRSRQIGDKGTGSGNCLVVRTSPLQCATD